MRTLDVAFLPSPGDHDVAIVVDVLRMTTTTAAMLAAGASEVAVVAEVDAARAEAARSGALLFGERGGVALDGFDGGNSPLELDAAALAGRRAVVCTTNGSRAVEAAAGARHLLLGAIVNAPAVARRAASLATRGVTVVCAGTEGRVSLDDVLAAGCIVRALLAEDPALLASDAALVALAVAEGGPGLRAGLAAARHGRTLEGLGFGADLDYAAGLGSLAIVPERRRGDPPTFTA